MKRINIIGREREMEELSRCMESNRSEFVIVYGRRRVGKTFLVDSFFEGLFDFTFVGGHNLTKAKQLRGFAKALKRAANMEKQPELKTWEDAFDALEEYLESLPADKRKVVFIDEMPWIDTAQSEFVEALEYFWNGWGARRTDIVFIASGSVTSWMMDNLVDNSGGLHARITHNIYVRPFTLRETSEYMQSRGFTLDYYSVLQLYMIMGGIPFYLSLLNPNESLLANIDRLYFRRNGELRTEFDELYSAIFKNADKYLQIVSILNQNKEGLTYAQIMKMSGLAGERLTTVLRNLEKCDFIITFTQFGNKSRGTLYRLSDFYTLFYFKYIDKADSKDEEWWTHNHNSRMVESWQGRTFELVCLTHLPQIRQKLGISGISTSASSWRYVPANAVDGEHGAQIDLVIERSDRVINLCEMKFSVSKFIVTKDYEERIRTRMQIFREKTKTNYSLVNTFVTTFGVSDGLHRSIVDNELTADDLFC